MLAQLSIKDFAIIDEISLSFNEGLTVLTGETGAGKSIIIDAVQLLAGGRGSVDYVRHGTKQAFIEGLFILESKKHAVFSIAKDYGIEMEDDMLVLQRTITNKGKSICRVNGKLVTLAILREFGQTLIDIHSQHETQSLMEPANHLNLLDLYDQPLINDSTAAYDKLYRRFVELKKAHEQLSTDEQELAHRLDLLLFQKKELEQAGLVPDEDTKLEAERDHLINYEKIYLGVQEAYNALHGEHRGLDWLNQAQMALQNIEDYDASLTDKAKQLTNSYYLIEEMSYELRHFNEGLHYDKHRLNEIESRLHEIDRLKRKYGPTVNDILEYIGKINEEIEQIENKDSHLESIQTKMIETAKDAYLEAKNLHDVRKQIADKLVLEIKKELEDLYLSDASFSVNFESFPSVHSEADYEALNFQKHGLDQVTFYISTNVGEPEKPIHRVASGGELSRIMLAIKKIFSIHQGVTSVIFDEVDTGVSGRVAQSMGEKIFEISTHSQVLCITHLPQVAAMADDHLLITKETAEDRTATDVIPLKTDQSIDELGRMMTGSQLTKTAKKHGQELLNMADEYKQKIK